MSIQCKVIDPGEGCTSVKLELLAMQLVRSLCKANFDLNVQCLGQLVPWMFACDRRTYASWLPIHINDMILLKEQKRNVPSVYKEFVKL